METTQLTQTNTNTTVNYMTYNVESVNNRLKELENEWDLERVYELNTSFSALSGTLLGKIIDKHYTSLPLSTTVRLVNETGQDWNAPVTLFKSMGYRTKEEIEQEKRLLSALKEDSDSDFQYSPKAVA